MTPMLGDVLRSAHAAADTLDAALREAIEARREDPGSFARAAVTRFEREAGEEDWATLLSTIRRADRPGAACLDAMVRWQLARTSGQAPATRKGQAR